MKKAEKRRRLVFAKSEGKGPPQKKLKKSSKPSADDLKADVLEKSRLKRLAEEAETQARIQAETEQRLKTEVKA